MANEGDLAANDGDHAADDGDYAANDGDLAANDGDHAADDGDLARKQGRSRAKGIDRMTSRIVLALNDRDCERVVAIVARVVTIVARAVVGAAGGLGRSEGEDAGIGGEVDDRGEGRGGVCGGAVVDGRELSWVQIPDRIDEKSSDFTQRRQGSQRAPRNSWRSLRYFASLRCAGRPAGGGR